MIRYVIRKALAVLLASVAAMAIAAEDYFTGEGGKGLSISVEKPAVQNVGDDVSWLPDYANNVISDSIKKYSNIEVVERRY